MTATMSIVPRLPHNSTDFAKVAESTFLLWNIWRPKRKPQSGIGPDAFCHRVTIGPELADVGVRFGVLQG